MSLAQPTQQSVPFRFFVYVIESPSAQDLYHQRSESGILQQAANLNGIPCVSRCAISIEALDAALRFGLPEEMTRYPSLLPVLHLSCHGNTDGVGFSNGESLPWRDLRQRLRPINRALSGALIVCMSSCEGYSGSRMAMHLEDEDYPFLALIGNTGEPHWPETAIAFATLYHLLARGKQIPDAVEAMRVASGNVNFLLTTGQEARANYRQYLSETSLLAARRELEQVARQLPDGDEQSQRELERSDG